MSRYYDTVTHRFVNADGYFTTGLNPLDANMNIYCGNNPVNYSDPSGWDRMSDQIMSGVLAGGEIAKKAAKPSAIRSEVIQGVNLKDIYGKPNSRVYDNEGNWRQMGDDGWVKYDYHNTDHGKPHTHPHGVLNPNGEHMHVWDSNHKKGDSIPWKGSEEETLKMSDPAISWDDNFNFEFNFDFFNPPMGEKPFWETIWYEITHGG